MDQVKKFNENIIESFNKHGFAVVDDLIPPDWLDGMRYWALTTDYDPNQIYSGGYRTRDFGDNLDTGANSDYFPIPELRNVVEHLSFLEILKDKKFCRGWFFIHRNKCPGVGPHADPAAININIWVTPDWCIEDEKKNGLLIYDQKKPDDWSWEDYNRKSPKIDNFLKNSKAKHRRIVYKWNRATIFNSAYFHTTDDVHMKPEHHNKRINYTFMFIDKDKNASDYL